MVPPKRKYGQNPADIRRADAVSDQDASALLSGATGVPMREAVAPDPPIDQATRNKSEAMIVSVGVKREAAIVRVADESANEKVNALVTSHENRATVAGASVAHEMMVKFLAERNATDGVEEVQEEQMMDEKGYVSPQIKRMEM